MFKQVNVMREYDGKEYRHRHTDLDRSKGINFVSNVLGYSPDIEGIKYDLTFYSGGIGVLDRLSFSCSINDEKWHDIKEKMDLYSPGESELNEEWGEDFRWLVNRENEKISIHECACRFINKNKKDFQGVCVENEYVFFSSWSNVNSWTAVWGDESNLNYLYFDQG